MLERSDRTAARPGEIKRLPIGYGRNIPFPPVDFPPYERQGNDYPKIVQQTCDEAYQKAWRERNSYVDERSGKTCYTGGMPRLGTVVAVLADAEAVHAGYADAVGDPVTLHSKDDEARWIAGRGPVAPVAELPRVPAAAAPAGNPEVAAVRAEIEERRKLNAELAELLAEQTRLQAQLAGEAVPDKPKRAGWPKGKKRGPRAQAESGEA